MIKNFAIDFAGKIGPPIFSGTLVACLLSGKFESIHAILMIVAILLICINYLYVKR